MRRSILRFIIVAVAVALMATRCGLVRDPEAPISLPVHDIPGLSEEAVRADGHLWESVGVTQWFPKSRTGVFELRLLDSRLFPDSGSIFLHTDADGLTHLAREIRFVQAQSSRVVGIASLGQVASGATEATKAIAASLFDVFKHPIDTMTGMYGGVGGLVDYAKLVAEGKAKLSEDIEFFADGYWLNVCTQVAREHGCSYLEFQTPEAQALVEALARPRIAGRATVEILTLFAPVALMRVTRGVEVGGEVARAGGEWRHAQQVARCAEAFSEGERVQKALLRAERFTKIAKSDVCIRTIVGSLIDPAKLGTLTTRPAASGRLHQLMAHLYEHETGKGNISELLEKVAGRNRGIFDAKIDLPQIEKTYQEAKEWGIFDEVGNIERMKRRESPTIGRGPFKGQAIHVDHIIPWSLAPETRTTFGNLRYLPERVNVARSNKVDGDMIAKIDEYAKSGLLSNERVAELLRPNKT